MPKGVEHTGGEVLIVAVRVVSSSVMPKGVEHIRANGDARRKLYDVSSSVMPKGVEHASEWSIFTS